KESGNTSAKSKLLSNHQPKSFGRDHNNIYVFRRHDRLVINRESMGKEECLARQKQRGDFPFKNSRHLSIWYGEKDNFTPATRLSGIGDFESVVTSGRPRPTPCGKSDDDVHP